MRYQAMVITEKRTKGGHPMDYRSRNFGVWDWTAGKWWTGKGEGRVAFPEYDVAERRAESLNEIGAAASVLPARERFGTLYRGGQRASHPFAIDGLRTSQVQVPSRGGEGPVVEEDHVYEYLKSFYQNESSKWDAGAAKHVTEYDIRRGWYVAVQTFEVSEGRQYLFSDLLVPLEDWITGRQESRYRIIRQWMEEQAQGDF